MTILDDEEDDECSMPRGLALSVASDGQRVKAAGLWTLWLGFQVSGQWSVASRVGVSPAQQSDRPAGPAGLWVVVGVRVNS